MPLPELPSQLKFLQSLLARANELDGHDPIMAHYCRLHAAQQILGQNLHVDDSQVASFASALLDQIEQSKAEESSPLATEQAQAILNDDETAYVYVENFAMNVFAKADAEIYNHRTTKVTASKLMAAATFLDVLKVFKDLDPGITEKIKYSKFQAARILKAYKEGQDPNDYEPPQPVEPNGDEEQEETDLGQLQKEVDQEDEVSHTGGIDRDDDELNRRPPATVTPVQPSSFLQEDQEEDQARAHQDPVLPSAPPVLPKAPAAPPKGTPTRMIPGGPPLPSAPSYSPEEEQQRAAQSAASAAAPSPSSYYRREQPPAPAAVTPTKPITRNDVASIMNETEIVSNAQKHAKYAISALNYEDMDTAVSELTKALDLLKGHQK